MVPDDVLDLPLDIVITGDGSQIIYQQKIVQEYYLNKKQVQEILSSLKDRQVGLALETKHQVYMNEMACTILKQANADKGITSLENEKITYCNNLKYFNQESMLVSKICIWSKQKLDKRKDLQYVQSLKIGTYYYDEVISLLAGKGKAMQKIQELLKINKEDMMCFGDGVNDISMFQECGQAIAMANSVAKLKEVATSICPITSQDGIYKTLVKNKIIEGEV